MDKGKPASDSTAGNGNPLSPQELEVVRQLLIRKREELTRNRDTQLRELTTPDKHHLADLDEMASDVNTDSYCEIIDIGTSTVGQIDAALEKLDQGTYGVCEDCEDPIPRPRLEALPFAGLCIECQRKKEKDEVRW